MSKAEKLPKDRLARIETLLMVIVVELAIHLGSAGVAVVGTGRFPLP